MTGGDRKDVAAALFGHDIHVLLAVRSDLFLKLDVVCAALAARPYDDVYAALLDDDRCAFAGRQRDSIEVLLSNRHVAPDRAVRVERRDILPPRFRGGW